MTPTNTDRTQTDLPGPGPKQLAETTQERAGCLVCGGPLNASRLPELLQCCVCGFITADVDISDEEFKAIYGPDYFHGEEYADYVQEETSLKENFRERLATLLRFAGEPSGKFLFEIGCAFGFFLDVARERFARVSGIDISEEGVAHARDTLGLDATACDVLDHEFPDGPDIVCMWDVIEHLKSPDDVLARVSDVMAPGGLVAITTGDIGSLNARMRGRRWRMIHPPSHLHYFSKTTLTRLLDRMGFDVIHIEHPGVTRTFGQIFYGVLVLRQNMPGLYKVVEKLPFMNREISLNLFDIMYVIARKRAGG